MVQARALSIKRDSLSSARVGLPWTSPGPSGPSAGDERARRELVLLAQCESHIRAEAGRQRTEGTWGQLLLGLLWAQGGPTILSPLGEGPSSSAQTDSLQHTNGL